MKQKKTYYWYDPALTFTQPTKLSLNTFLQDFLFIS
jgi:hypothetical protein